MKHLKRFEDINEDSLMVGGYVVCNEDLNLHYNDENIVNFISNNVGQLVDIKDYRKTHPYAYLVKYENIPDNLLEYFNKNIRGKTVDNIIYHSKNREDAEVFLNANKYNL